MQGEFDDSEPRIVDQIRQISLRPRGKVKNSVWRFLTQPLGKVGHLEILTRLLYLIWTIRPDLQRAFDLEKERDAEGFAVWVAIHGAAEYGGLKDIAAEIEHASRPVGGQSHELDLKVLSSFMRGLQRLRPDLAEVFPLDSDAGLAGYITWYLRNRVSELGLNHALPGWQADALERTWIDGEKGRLPLPALARLLLLARADLQKKFDINSAAGLHEYRRWFLLNGFRETDWINHSTPSYRSWLGQVDGSGLSRVASFLWLERQDLQENFVLSEPEALMAWARSHAWAEHGLPADLFGVKPAKLSASPSDVPHEEYPFGVNLVGYPFGDLGIGEDVRMAAESLSAAGIPFCILNLDPGRHISQTNNSLEKNISSAPRYNINLFCLTAPEHARAVFVFGRDLVDGRQNIGYWPWELDEWPAEWRPCFDLVDEIWVSSAHTRRALEIVSPVPVLHMPMAVVAADIKDISRPELDLDEDKFLFIFSFDINSHYTRKNPLAIVEAFDKAFPDKLEPVGLVVKILHADAGGTVLSQLLEQARRDPRIRVIPETLSRARILSLYGACDCFVSLHRAEGFGRGIAEAMLIGKPVVVTGWSGNVDFTTPETAWIVRHEMRLVGDGDYPHAAGMRWAEPSIEDAAVCMMAVVNSPEQSHRKASAGQKFIRDNYNPNVVGSRYRRRLSIFRTK